MTTDEFRTLALSFPGTDEAPHFERAAFKVVGKRIFATMLERDNTVNMPLPPGDQSQFCKLDKKAIYPVPNKWGEKGWTTFEIRHLDRAIVQSALEVSYNDAAHPKPKGKSKK